jgi:deoxycytidylate deaminase
MKRIEGSDFTAIKQYFEQAATAAKNATCLKAKCGAVIIKDGLTLGIGSNSPALNDEGQRLCASTMMTDLRPKYDKTCCIHAEWRAVLEACKAHPEKLEGSTLYFMRIDEAGAFTDAGEPFCTTCSRFTMEAGISEFALYNKDGADIYPLAEYNLKSYEAYLV